MAKHDHIFWRTQPVPDFNEDVVLNGPILTSGSIRETPYQLPVGFDWVNVTDYDELYKFLSENYVEDNDNAFRCNYSTEFLKWALGKAVICLGVKTSQKKLVGFISSVPVRFRVNKHEIVGTEVNFLCVHKKLRARRLAPVLIRELARRLSQEGLSQHIYTGGDLIPRPVTTCRYHHRPLNIKKLLDTGFLAKKPGRTRDMLEKLYRLDGEIKLRPMKKEDITDCWMLLTSFLNKFELTKIFTEDEFEYYFLPRDTEHVVYTYVIETSGKITDLISYYSIPFVVLADGQLLNTAYLFYYANTSTPLKDLINQTLLLTKTQGFDVFNCLDNMDNNMFLKELNFFTGDGILYYYLYNWRCKQMIPEQLAITIV